MSRRSVLSFPFADASPFTQWVAAIGLCWLGVGLFALALTPVPALAAAPGAPTPSTDAARADAAFEEGRALYVSGRFKEALEKFELSQRADPSPGTLLNLASCHEATGDLLQALS